MLLAYLDPVVSEHSFLFKEWARIAKSQGVDFDYPLVGSENPAEYSKGLERARYLLENADAFFAVSNALFLICPEFVDVLHRRVASGSRLLVQPNVWLASGGVSNTTYPLLDWWNAFLAPFDLCATKLRLSFENRTDNVPIKRDAASFRDPALFAGVDDVLFEDPGAVWYGGESLPVLIATDKHLAVDWDSDLVADWNGRDLACMAVWHGRNDGAVLFCAGSLFHDPYRGYHGRLVHGIDVNARLGCNVLKFLAGGKISISPEDMCHRIEINLVDFVLGVVKASDHNWWVSCIPANIRQECAKRHEEEACRFPKEAYFGLIDLKTIIGKNWPLFEAHLRAEGCQGGKDRSLEWLDRLNEIRRLVGHPLKKHVAVYTFSSDECQLLKNIDDLTMRLRRRVK
jgi:hypothetical protein